MGRHHRSRGTIGTRKDREGFWVRYFDRHGLRHQVYGGKSLEDAEDELEARLTHEEEARRGLVRDVILATFAADELFPLYRTRHGRKSFQAFSGRILGAAAHFGAQPIADVRRADAEDFLASLARKGRKPRTLVAYRSALSVAWKAALDRRAARENVWLGQRVPRAQDQAVPFLEEADLLRLYHEAPRAIRPIVTILGETGMRRSEALRLRWGDVAPDCGRLTVTKSKPGRVRDVPVLGAGQALLASMPRGRDRARVFKALGKTWHKRAQRLWRTARKRAMLPQGFKLGWLRHARASLLVRAGVPIPDVAKWLGHRDGQLVLSRYGHHAPANALDAARERVEAVRRGTSPRSPRSSAGGRRRGKTGSRRKPSGPAPSGARRRAASRQRPE